jgi:hypothetical protein
MKVIEFSKHRIKVMKTTNSARVLFHIYRKVTNIHLLSAQNQTIHPETQLLSVMKKFLV